MILIRKRKPVVLISDLLGVKFPTASLFFLNNFDFANVLRLRIRAYKKRSYDIFFVITSFYK